MLALGAQASALVAPLADLPVVSRAAAVATAPGAPGSVDESSAPAHHHDPSTCAACIAQAIVAINSGAPASVAVPPGASRLVRAEELVTLRTGAARIIRSRGPPQAS